MRTSRRLLPALLLLGALTVPAPLAPASEPETPPEPGTLAHLGRPAQKRAVDEVLAALPEMDTARCVRLCGVLGVAGGAEAVRALEAVADGAERPLLMAALEAATRIGLRSDALAVRARKALTAIDAELSRAGARALGTLGDGRDVADLLDVAADTSHRSALRRAAFAALQQLSGVRLAYDVPRWEAWWRTAAARADKTMPATIASLEAGVRGAGAREALRTLERTAWIQLPLARRTARRWLEGSDPALRGAACRIVAALGLADMAAEVASALRAVQSGTYADDARRALEKLGVGRD